MGTATQRRFFSKVRKTSTCWLWLGYRNHQGYGGFHDGGSVRAHRWAYARFVAPIPDGLCVCHHCDNPSCVRPSHLFVGTHADNWEDAFAKGRVTRDILHVARHRRVWHRGESVVSSRLTVEKVGEIRRRVGAGESCSSLADHYGVNRSTVKRVVARTSWAHV